MSDLLLIGAIWLMLYIGLRLVRYTRRKGGNPDLWGTIFESLSHYVQPLDTLKEPEQYINKIKKNSGEDEPPARGTSASTDQ